MNNLALAGALATAPSTAFAELRERPRFWFPLLLVVLTTAAIVYWYYSIVDIEWLKDVDVQQQPEDADNARGRARARRWAWWPQHAAVGVGDRHAHRPAGRFPAARRCISCWPPRSPRCRWDSSIGSRSACWTSLPMLLGTVVAAIFLIMSDNVADEPERDAAAVAQRTAAPPAHGQPRAGAARIAEHPGAC